MSKKNIVDTQLTVEQCLAELREMFPDLPDNYFAIAAQGYDIRVGRRAFHGDTLSEAMDRARAWRNSQP